MLGQLKGQAYDLVLELSVTADNYDIALQILKENYEDHDLILKTLIYKLIDLPGPAHNYKDLQSFRISLSCNLKALSTHEDLSSAAWFLNHLIQKKLSQKTCEELYHRYQKNYFSFTEIEEGLREICKHMMSNKKEVKPIKKDSDQKEIKVKVKPKSEPKERYKDSGVIWKEEVGSYTTAIEENVKSNGTVPSGFSQSPVSRPSVETGTRP